MTTAEILAIVQMFVTIEPIAEKAINSSIAMFQSSTLSSDDKMKMLVDMAEAMKPMELKPA